MFLNANHYIIGTELIKNGVSIGFIFWSSFALMFLLDFSMFETMTSSTSFTGKESFGDQYRVALLCPPSLKLRGFSSLSRILH